MSLIGLIMKAKYFHTLLILIVESTTVISMEIKRADFGGFESLLLAIGWVFKLLYDTWIAPSCNLKCDIINVRVHSYMLVRLAVLFLEQALNISYCVVVDIIKFRQLIWTHSVDNDVVYETDALTIGVEFVLHANLGLLWACLENRIDGFEAFVFVILASRHLKNLIQLITDQAGRSPRVLNSRVSEDACRSLNTDQFLHILNGVCLLKTLQKTDSFTTTFCLSDLSLNACVVTFGLIIGCGALNHL